MEKTKMEIKQLSQKAITKLKEFLKTEESFNTKEKIEHTLRCIQVRTDDNLFKSDLQQLEVYYLTKKGWEITSNQFSRLTLSYKNNKENYQKIITYVVCPFSYMKREGRCTEMIKTAGGMLTGDMSLRFSYYDLLTTNLIDAIENNEDIFV